MVSKLFRDEALQAKREAWFGRVQITQPLPAKLIALAGVALLAVSITYAILGNYTRRVSATGILLPRDGLLNLSSNVAGIVASSMAVEGQKVKKGQLLFVIDREANSMTGPTVRRQIESLTQQKALLQEQRDLRKTAARAEKAALEAQILNDEAQHAELAQHIAVNQKILAAPEGQKRSARRSRQRPPRIERCLPIPKYRLSRASRPTGNGEGKFSSIRGHNRSGEGQA